VTDGHPCPRDQAAHALGDGLDVVDPVVDEEDLPAPVELAVDRVANQAVIVLGDACR
jgi:hypothetical protein